jgi:hypothetical protein
MASGKTAGRKAGGAPARKSARERVAAAREADRRRRLRRIVIGAVCAAAAVVVAAVIVGVLAGGDGGSARPGSGRGVPAGALPSWSRPDDTADRARAIGLSVAPMEGTARHFHTHLDILVDGRPVAVPAGLGIATSGQEMSELHTHDTTGVLHIEAPTTGKRYVLGQLFTEWGLRLDATDLGGLKAGGGRTLTAYVDGKGQSGDPADIELTPHREIALVYGSANARPRVPSSYAFASGE